MTRLNKALRLSTLCFLASSALAACGEKAVVKALPIPPERMDCVYVAKRPALPPEHKIDWGKVTSVLQAKQEHERYVGTVRSREGKVAGYVLEIEGRYFACSNDAQWLREREKAIID